MTTANQQALMGELLALVRKDRARRSRWRKFGEFLGKASGHLIASLVKALLGGLLFMLAVGVMHAEWLPGLPTIGYWWAVLIAYLLRGALALNGVSSSKKAADR